MPMAVSLVRFVGVAYSEVSTNRKYLNGNGRHYTGRFLFLIVNNGKNKKIGARF